MNAVQLMRRKFC